MKGGDLIASSLRLIGVLASGETASGPIIADSQLVLQQMVDSWQADRLMIFTINIAEFPLVPGQQTYTYGTGGNFNAARPARIERASIVSLTNPAQPLELNIPIYTDKDWQQQIPVKLINTTLPQVLYDDGSFPLRNLSFWPIPTVVVNTRLYSWLQLTTFTDLTTDILFPPGYAEALRYNLAMRLIAEMPGNFNPIMISTTLQLANESLARIKAMNLPVVEASCDDALVGRGGRYNYFSDMPVGGRN